MISIYLYISCNSTRHIHNFLDPLNQKKTAKIGHLFLNVSTSNISQTFEMDCKLPSTPPECQSLCLNNTFSFDLSEAPNPNNFSTSNLSILSTESSASDTDSDSDLSTPDLSLFDNMDGDITTETPNPNNISTPDISILSTESIASDTGNSDSDSDADNARNILREIRVKNVGRIVIGTLNINSLASKIDQLKVIICGSLDILVIQETKLDSSFPEDQFLIDGYRNPYRLDRNRHGGGVMVYIREDIPSKELHKHKFTKNVEGLFIEVNLRKTKLLLFGTYHSQNPEYGLKDDDYFEQVGLALDVYSSYEKFLLAGDFNIEEIESPLGEFLKP